MRKCIERLLKSVLILVGVAAIAVQAGRASAEPWTFGVMSDTQDTIGAGVNSVSTNIIAAVNQQFVAQGVKFVVQVGDLTDNGSVAGLQTRLDANAPLTAAGIPFYGLRGNHESSGAAQTFFNANYIPASTPDRPVVVSSDTSSYSVTVNNTKIVLLDYNGTSGNTSALDSATAWMGGQLSAADHEQAFVFHHKNLLGQNHKDNVFGSGNDSNPTQQNNFIGTLQNNGVRYDISGHDHMDHRAMVTSPDGNSKVQELICASDSTKFYAASSGFSARETTFSDEQGKIGYYTFTVDGPRVTGKYWATTKTTSGTSDGDIVANPVWTLQETFGYSLNGKQFTVPRGVSYAGVQDQIAAGGGYQGTSMSILTGSNNTTATAEGSRPVADDVNTGWTSKAAGLASDILTLWGMSNAFGSTQTDPFVLSLSYQAGDDIANAGGVYLVCQEANDLWVKAVDGNVGGTAAFHLGAYNSSYGLGDYGVDTATHTVWAVVNHNSNFAAVPEPSTIVLLGIGALAMAFWGQRRRTAK